MLKPGLYEKLIDTETAKALAQVPEERKASAPVDAAEAPWFFLPMWLMPCEKAWRP